MSTSSSILTLLVYLLYPACTPKGREKRIEHLMETTGEVREVCASIVYGRDAKRFGFTFTEDEREEAMKLLQMLEQGRFVLPADRGS